MSYHQNKICIRAGSSKWPGGREIECLLVTDNLEKIVG